MQLLKRIGYYLIGLSLGSIAVAFFWKQKGADFDYLPNARVLKFIRSTKYQSFSKKTRNSMNILEIDSLMIVRLLKTGKVDLSKSKPHQKPCKEYWIDSKNMQKKFSIIVKKCDSIVTIEKLFIKK